MPRATGTCASISAERLLGSIVAALIPGFPLKPLSRGGSTFLTYRTFGSDLSDLLEDLSRARSRLEFRPPLGRPSSKEPDHGEGACSLSFGLWPHRADGRSGC